MTAAISMTAAIALAAYGSQSCRRRGSLIRRQFGQCCRWTVRRIATDQDRLAAARLCWSRDDPSVGHCTRSTAEPRDGTKGAQPWFVSECPTRVERTWYLVENGVRHGYGTGGPWFNRLGHEHCYFRRLTPTRTGPYTHQRAI